MLTMTQVHDIRKLFFEEGKNISEIARCTGHDRKTIRAYLEKENWNIEVPVVSQNEPNFPKLEPFKAIIDEWLLEDKKARRKQRHTATRVYNRLKEKYKDDFTCSYRTVAGYVAVKKKEIFGTQRRAVMPLEHIPGEAQVDFGDCDFYLNSKLYSGKHLNLSFPYSNQGYVQLFKGENQQCLFEGLVAIFYHIGGVPTRIWFDNASTIVTKVLREGGRNLTDSFLRFQEHYRFEFAFCNLNSGHEKGSVEAKVGYHRRNLMVPVPHITDLKAFNQELLVKCETDAHRAHYRKDATICQLHEKDRKALIKLPTIPLDLAKYITVKTNAYGKFYLNKGFHEYSVSPRYANCRVLIRIDAHEVIALDDSHRDIVRHDRLYGDFKQSSMQWLPYLNQLSRNPGALKYTGIYGMFPQTLQNFLDKCSKSQTRNVLKAIAVLTEKDNFASAVKTVETALIYDTYDPDSLVNLHRRLHGVCVDLPPMKLGNKVPKLSPVNVNLMAYDKGLQGEGGAPTC